MLRSLRVLPVALLVLFAACGPKALGPEGPHLLWSADAQSLDNPFPDARLASESGLALRPNWYVPFLAPGAQTPKTKGFFLSTGKRISADVTGFGAFGAVLVRPSEPLDPKSLAGHVSRLLKRADGWAVLEADVPVFHLTDLMAARGLERPADFPEFFLVRPTVLLPEGEDGLLVVRKGLTTTDGRALERGRDFAASKPDLAGAAAALGLSPDDVLLALPQHAPNTSAPFTHLAAWADAHPAAVTIPAHELRTEASGEQHPVGVWKATDADFSTLSPWFQQASFSGPPTHVGQVVLGTFDARDLRDHDVWSAAWVQDPAQAPVVPLRFVLSLPAGPKPTGGWPVVLGQHGVGGRNTPRVGNAESFCLAWAEPLAARGLGCLGIDAPEHGSRGAFTHFFTMDDVLAMRDRFREMTFDLLQVERAAVTLDVDGDGTADVAPQVRYFGNSLGAIMGSNFVPYANRVSSAVLNVPGAGLTNLIMSHYLQDTIGLLLVAQTDLIFDSKEYVATFPLFRAAAQPVLDPGDPITAVPHVPAGRAVFVQEGLGDLTIPNDTTEDLARAMSCTVATGALSGTTPLRVLSRIDPSKYLSGSQLAGYNGHDVMWNIPTAHEQVLRFLETDGRELTAP